MTKEEEAINVLGALDFPCEHCPMNSTCTEKGTYLCTDAFQTAAVAIHEKMERKNYGDEPEGRLNAICEQCHIDYSDRLFLHELLRAYENEDERENPKPLTLDELREMNNQHVWCAELNTEVEVIAPSVGWVYIIYNYPGNCGIETFKGNKLTLYRHSPKETKS